MSGPVPIMMLVLNLEVGGQERMLLELTRSLNPNSFKALICCLEGRGRLADQAEAAGIEVLALNKPGGFSLATVHRLRTLVRERNIALIHSHNNPGLIYGGLTVCGTSVKHVHTKHGVGSASAKARWLNRIASSTVDTFVPVSDALLAQAQADEGIPRAKLKRIDNGVDLEPFLGIARSSGGEGGPVIGHVARLNPIKNQRLLINLFADFVSNQPTAKLVIVGDGPDRAELESLAAELGISGSVCFAGIQSEIAAYLARFDWFALTSHSEGTPISVIEAMASGLPVTSTRVGGMPAIVSEGKTGFLADPEDRTKMLDDWGRLAQDQTLRRNMGKAARQFAMTHYDIHRMTQAYEAVYHANLAR